MSEKESPKLLKLALKILDGLLMKDFNVIAFSKDEKGAVILTTIDKNNKKQTYNTNE